MHGGGRRDQHLLLVRHLIRGCSQGEAQEFWRDKPPAERGDGDGQAQLRRGRRRRDDAEREAACRALSHTRIQPAARLGLHGGGQRHGSLRSAAAEDQLGRLDGQHAHANRGRRVGRGKHFRDVRTGAAIQLAPDRLRERGRSLREPFPLRIGRPRPELQAALVRRRDAGDVLQRHAGPLPVDRTEERRVCSTQVGDRR
jgi:hypothetical protein